MAEADTEDKRNKDNKTRKDDQQTPKDRKNHRQAGRSDTAASRQGQRQVKMKLIVVDDSNIGTVTQSMPDELTTSSHQSQGELTKTIIIMHAVYASF